MARRYPSATTPHNFLSGIPLQLWLYGDMELLPESANLQVPFGLFAKLLCRLHALGMQQKEFQDAMNKLEDDAESMQRWQEEFEAESSRAMQMLMQHETDIQQLQCASMLLAKIA